MDSVAVQDSEIACSDFFAPAQLIRITLTKCCPTLQNGILTLLIVGSVELTTIRAFSSLRYSQQALVNVSIKLEMDSDPNSKL